MSNQSLNCDVLVECLAITVHMATFMFLMSGFFVNQRFSCDFGEGHRDVRINLFTVCERDKCDYHSEKSGI